MSEEYLSFGPPVPVRGSILLDAEPECVTAMSARHGEWAGRRDDDEERPFANNGELRRYQAELQERYFPAAQIGAASASTAAQAASQNDPAFVTACRREWEHASPQVQSDFGDEDAYVLFKVHERRGDITIHGRPNLAQPLQQTTAMSVGDLVAAARNMWRRNSRDPVTGCTLQEQFGSDEESWISYFKAECRGDVSICGRSAGVVG